MQPDLTELENRLWDAADELTGGREKQAGLLKALLDDDDFRARAGKLVMGSIYDSFTDDGVARPQPRED